MARGDEWSLAGQVAVFATMHGKERVIAPLLEGSLGRQAVEDNVARTGKSFIETDMRAHRNPTRMRVIRRAAVNLIRRYRSLCPACDHPGFWVTDRPLGLPCSWCGGPTNAVRADISSCEGCGHRVERPVAATTADPGLCNDCNPEMKKERRKVS